MTLNSKNIESGAKFDPVDPGSYAARTVQIIDLGLQPQEFKGETKTPKNEIMVTYELLDEFLTGEDGEDIEDKPRWQSETFALNSLGSDKAKSTKRYYALDPKEEHEGDWANLLDVTCMVNLVHNKKQDKLYVNVDSVSAMRPKDAKKAPALVNDPKLFTMDDPDLEVYESLPDWIKDKIKNGLEFEGSKLEDMLGGGSTSDDDEDEQEDW